MSVPPAEMRHTDTSMSLIARGVVSFIETGNEQNAAGSLGGLSQTNLQGGLS